MAVGIDMGDDSIVLERFRPLNLVLNTPKGRGVFASAPIPAGTIVDISPVLILDPQENVEHIEKTSLYHYTYNWPIKTTTRKVITTQAIILGLGSMFNHSTDDQNVGWTRKLDKEVIVYRALRDIHEGEELCISYGDHLWFVDADAEKSKAEPEVGEEMLGRIELDDV
ncbi:SET domain-containing protein 7 [Fulvia fulva]|uniref:SET domain-containing protein 7 n=1 Tax=Passalora fulva TaxID=5499 RepID=A0A9Q8UVT3_PASFU|nr:SET domain-containing protein 7 [Fulvia fulva]KAK4610684.1 SET domain-containing protein 7 [Fulvia fulva]KAK4611298.1 SET domain-containing protein 7 [Fulvia fulva]UJO24293.1 SET domain-containing protein 7 [Fulvia fulva]WPV22115.1 SET domain-containing protein 7 [Fulvia fulva]WPV37005.1 SET domain-containing protein 7 [Fulvia fulva]